MKCASCGSNEVLEVDIELGDGARIQFISCGFCESKLWRNDEKTSTLEEVLELASVNRPK